MRDTIRIVRDDGERMWDPATGTYTEPVEITVYDGPCQIKPTFSPAERSTDSGDRPVVLQSYEAVLPWGASSEVDSGDFAIVTASDDGWVVGERLPVGYIENVGNRTARHITVWVQDRKGDV